MQETKVYNVLTKFSAYELNRLQKFVESPYFNKNENCILLLLLIRKSIKKGIVAEEKSSFWKSIFSSKKYDDLKFRKLCNDLLKLIEKFIVYEEFENNPLHQASYLVKAVSKQKLEKL